MDVRSSVQTFHHSNIPIPNHRARRSTPPNSTVTVNVAQSTEHILHSCTVEPLYEVQPPTVALNCLALGLSPLPSEFEIDRLGVIPVLVEAFPQHFYTCKLQSFGYTSWYKMSFTVSK